MTTVVTFGDLLKTYPQKTQERVKLYKKVIRLRTSYMYGGKKIAKILNVPRAKFEGWVYSGNKPEPIIAVNRLSELGFSFPLKIERTPKFELFVKLFSFTFGDGGISNLFQSYYTGSRSDLLAMKKEIKETLNLPSKIRRIENKNQFIAGRKINGTSFILRIGGRGSTYLGRLLCSAGAPIGDKVIKSYSIPNWIMNGPKWIKKLFLEVLLGNELQTPRLDKSRNISFSPIRFLQVKVENHKNSLRNFLDQIRKLLEEFGIKTSGVKEGKQRRDRRKDDLVSRQLYFYIRKAIINVMKFYQTFQLTYALRKQRLFKESIEKAKMYLKEELLKNKLYFKALKLSKGGLGCRRIARKLGIYPRYNMVDGWLNNSQKPEYFDKIKELEKIMNSNTST